MARSQMSESERREIEELIPWHAAGTLSSEEARRVDAALAADPGLAHSYAMALEELGGSIELNEDLPVPSGRILQRLQARLDAEPARPRALSLDLGTRIAGLFERMTPRAMAWSAAAAALVIVVEGGVIGGSALRHVPQATPVYETASGPAAPATPGAIVLVKFRDEATSADITRLLRARGAAIVSGPSGGLYKVRVADTALAQDRLSAVAADLQKDKAVAFAAPSP